MTARKTATTRRTRTTKPKPEPAEEELQIEPEAPQEPQYPPGYPQYPPQPGQPHYGPYPYYAQPSGTSPLTVLMFVVMIAVIGFLGYMVWSDKQATPDNGGGGRSVAQLTRDIEAAMSGPDAEQHAKYMHFVCRRVAGQMRDDFKAASPKYDQRSEVNELVGLVGYFATGSEGANEYDLPKVIEQAAREYLGEEGGAMDADDQAKAVEMWEDLAAAFLEASK